jgi:GMP synthase-like glutamine amidotransferase
MRVLAIIHGSSVRPEVFGDVIAEDRHELVEWDIRHRGAPPDGFDAVLVFGGAQNVGEELEHPWLHEEYTALRRWVEKEQPVLGICLGAQTLAHALGWPVGRIEPALVGFHDTVLTAEGERDPVLGVLPQRFRSYNQNGYAVRVPASWVLLADGPVAQAFRHGTSAWGVQFHPEVRRDQALSWWSDEELPRPRAELAREFDSELAGWQEHGRSLCRAFLAAAGG